MASPWIRQIEVIVGPLKEWQGGSAGQGIRVYGDGTNENLRVKFVVHKHAQSTASPSVVQIYNLSESTRRALRIDESKIQLNVGWMNTGLRGLTQGTLLAATHHREGADIITTLTFIAGWGGVNRTINMSWKPAEYALKPLIIGVAQSIPGVVVDEMLVNIPADKTTGVRGMALYGLASDILDKLAKIFGFSWSINDGVFQASMDGFPVSEKVVEVKPETGLLKAQPMLGSAFQKQYGVTVHSLLNPLIQPGRAIELKSDINPQLNGTHVLYAVSYFGDTHSSQWDCHAEAFTMFNWSPS